MKLNLFLCSIIIVLFRSNLFAQQLASSANSKHFLALHRNGSMWGMGVNSSGEFFNETVNFPEKLLQIGVEKDWLNIQVGSQNNIALKSDGSLWAWGARSKKNNNNLPTRLGIENNWRTISIGGGHSLAIKNDGSLWAWGENGYGQLGNGVNLKNGENFIYVEIPIQSVINKDWKSVYCGSGYSLALKVDNSLWGWGGNGEFALGNGTNLISSTPSITNSDNNWKIIDAGSAHNLAIKNDGSLWAWGNNESGQVGIGNYVSYQRTPTKIDNAIDWKLIATGRFHSLAIKNDGSLWAWGENRYGQLGNGTLIGQNVPTRIGNDNDWSLIEAGEIGSVAMKSDGSVWTWGYWAKNFLIPTKMELNLITQDTDGDGIMDDKDLCQNTIKGSKIDLNGCADYQKDTDVDGIMDDKDLCRNTIKGVKVDLNGCADYQKDTDGDGIMDDKDLCQNTIKGSKIDLNGCADYQKDTDGDGIMDDKDDCPTIKNPPAPTILKVNEFDLKTSNPIAGESYQWYLEGVILSGGTLSTLKANVSGNYTVQIKDANGCKSPISRVFTVLILGIEKENNGASIYPNPFNSIIKIIFAEKFGNDVSISIYNIKGALVYTKSSVQLNEMIDLSKLSEGTYLLKMEAIENENKAFLKLIKQF